MKRENCNSQYLVLFSNCFIVNGFKRSILIDTQRPSYTFLDLDLAKSLQGVNKMRIGDLISDDEEKNNEIFEFIEFLLNKEWFFLTSTPQLFPDIDLSWDSYSTISNSVIQINSHSSFFYKLIDELDALNCHYLEIHFLDLNKDIESFIAKLKGSDLRSISVYLPFKKDYYDNGFYNKTITESNRMTKFIVYGAESFSWIFQDKREGFFYTDDKIDFNRYCGSISSSLFEVNLQLYTEANNHNTCLNRKISIDVEGNIKNCPSMPQAFGNINDITLKEASNHPDFKKFWNITKDQIEVCKDCEFRYICTDCRAYLEDPADIYSKPLKCGYNPYTAEWEEWSTNPLKQKAIDHYGMREVLPEFKMKPDYVPVTSSN